MTDINHILSILVAEGSISSWDQNRIMSAIHDNSSMDSHGWKDMDEAKRMAEEERQLNIARHHARLAQFRKLQDRIVNEVGTENPLADIVDDLIEMIIEDMEK